MSGAVVGEGSAPPREGDFPRFSAGEINARRGRLAELLAHSHVDRVVVYGTRGSGEAVQWLSGWLVTREAAAVWAPREPVKLFVQYRNHVPAARRAVAADVEVAWGGPETARAVAEELRRRGGTGQRVGLVGPVSATLWKQLMSEGMEPVDLNAEYVQLRLVKSEEEIAWLRAGAELTDRAVAALESALRPGLSEFELVDVVERAYVPLGGLTHIHFLSVTALSNPDRCVPAQFPSSRRVREGDIVVCEVSAAYWGYAGQLLRTFVVGGEVPERVRTLHHVAEEAYETALRELRPGLPAEALLKALRVVQAHGLNLCDDLVHGFGGGYLPPVLGPDGFLDPSHASLELRPGMAIVVQPNVVTPDGRFGVQTGELTVLRAGGVEFLHSYPRGLRVVG